MASSTASDPLRAGPKKVADGKRPGHEIPGYQGYIPGKNPEADVFGKSFHDTNKQVASSKGNNQNRLATAKVSLAQEVHGSAHVPEDTHKGTKKLWRGSDSNSGHPEWGPGKTGGAVPGYCGYIPNKVENVFGVTYNQGNEHARTGQSGDIRHGQALDGNTVKSVVNHAQSARMLTGQGDIHKKATEAIPHYMGHVPGKKAENICGATFQVSNSKATTEFKAMINDDVGPNRDPWRRCSAPGVEPRRHSGAAKGKAIPHYAGYVPGKNPEAGVCGMTWKVATQFADDLHKAHREQKVATMGRPGTAPQTARGTRGSMSSRASQSEASFATSYTRSSGSQSARGPRPPPGISSRSQKDRTLGAGGHIPGYSGHRPDYASSAGGSSTMYMPGQARP